MSDLYDIARQELGLSLTEEIPAPLWNLLTETDTLCAKAGGEIRSRQIVALIILIWRQK